MLPYSKYNFLGIHFSQPSDEDTQALVHYEPSRQRPIKCFHNIVEFHMNAFSFQFPVNGRLVEDAIDLLPFRIVRLARRATEQS